MQTPTLDEVTVADRPEVWRRAGFDVEDDALAIGSARIRLAGDVGRGIVGCTMRAIADEIPDGLPISTSTTEVRAPREPTHPNGAVALDHLVVLTPGLDRTVPALERAGLDLRRIRDEGTPGGGGRQAFFLLAEVILEVVELPPDARGGQDGPARFWGLAFQVKDMDECAAYLGPRLGESRDAVQPGRRIATLRREAGIGPAVAFMTPARDRAKR